MRRDLSSTLSYGDYLRLDQLLAAQHTLSVPPQHDELLFIIQHQTTELWLKLVLHELRSARDLLRADDLAPALKRLARVKHIQKTLTEQWSVLATLTPTEYAEFRGFLSTSSGFQSWQYRAVEFILGNKNADMLRVFDHDPAAQAVLARAAPGAGRLRRVPRLPPPARAARAGRAARPRLDPGPHASTPSWCRPSPASTSTPTSSGRCTRRARSWSTSRTTSSSGASGTSRRSSAPSAPSAAPAGRAASPSCAARSSSRSSPSCTPCAPRSARRPPGAAGRPRSRAAERPARDGSAPRPQVGAAAALELGQLGEGVLEVAAALLEVGAALVDLAQHVLELAGLAAAARRRGR